jgi:hypothetical protein
MREQSARRQLTKTNDNEHQKAPKSATFARARRPRRLMPLWIRSAMRYKGIRAAMAGKAEDCGLSSVSPVSLVLTAPQVRRYLGISERRLYKLRKSGEILGEQLHGHWLIPKVAFFDRFGWPPGERTATLAAEPDHESPEHDTAALEEAMLKQPFPELMTPKQVEEHYGIFAGRIREACKLWRDGDRINGLQSFFDKNRFKVRPRWIDEWLERISDGPVSDHAA